jgi:hypothetical protein
MKNAEHAFTKEVEDEIQFAMEACEDLTRADAIERVTQDEFLTRFGMVEVRRFLIFIGVYQDHTDEWYSHLLTTGGHKKWDFVMGGKKYIFVSWKPLYE